MRLDQLNDQIDHFCRGCPDMYDCGGTDYAYGAPMHAEEWTCRADCDPDDLACTYHDEYCELVKERDELEAEDDDEE